MNLCFSKKSPRMNKGRNNQKLRFETWAPEVREKQSTRKYLNGEEYTRQGDEYKPRSSEKTKAEVSDEGYRRNRTDSKPSKVVESLTKREIGGSRSSGVDMEDRNELSCTKATVHKEKQAKTAEGFR